MKVWTELPTGRHVTLIAKIVDEKGPVYTIQYLSPTEDRDHGRIVYRYEAETYEIEDDSITEYLDTDDEMSLGFKPVDNGFVKYVAESDYEPSEASEGTDDDDETSLDEEEPDTDYSLDEE